MQNISSHEKSALSFLPLGGAGEIGMNLNLYAYGTGAAQRWLMVDLGVTFDTNTLPGVDVIMANAEYIIKRRDQLAGLVITHGHEDHIGAIPYLWPLLQCPIYATPFTAKLILRKLARVGFEEKDVPLHVVPLGCQCTLSHFNVEFVSLTHSIPEANALIIRTNSGTVLHTGDWKIDPDPLVGDDFDHARLSKLGDEGVDAVVCDSTNVLEDGTAGSEKEVRHALQKVMENIKGRIIVASFASNIARLQTVIHVAALLKRRVALVGLSMHQMAEVAHDVGYLDYREVLVDVKESMSLPSKETVLLCTGSQGEARAALGRIAAGTHPTVSLRKGDTVLFSSRVIPGNEKSVTAIYNKIMEHGVRVVTAKEFPIHVSGHPCRADLKELYAMVKPRLVVPVHGEVRHLQAHVKFARDCQVPKSLFVRNGDLVHLLPGEPKISKKVMHGRVVLDGNVLLNDDDSSLQERRQLAETGVVFIALALTHEKTCVTLPKISFYGVPQCGHENEDLEMFEKINHTVEDVLASFSVVGAKEKKRLVKRIRRNVLGVCFDIWGKRPIVEIAVSDG